MARRYDSSALQDDFSFWYKDAIIYELHVRSFFDSDADGTGDFRGLTEKLDYIQDLGVTALWLLPFYPSPLRDDGYDISDYRRINPAYGTQPDFRRFLREAHRRGIRVITELVLNHTSDQHPWFQRARLAKPGSRARDYYVWSDTPDKYSEARIIFGDFETSNWTWDTVARAYYWHRFYSHQPDLNFDNPKVRDEIRHMLDFWLSMGVDGFRLDAVPYLYEREGTTSENLPETYAYLRELRAYVDGRYRNRILLAEANQWPEDAAAYFGAGDMCHMAYHFPIMPRLFMAVRMEDRFPIIDILSQTPDIPDTCQWVNFLRNHDELTLEMVTDEERDYMYRAYAQDPQMRINLGIRRRLAPLLGNQRRRIELMNGLLFSLPGTPVIYYGDEIGMGDNIYLGDRNGVRTPMQWSPGRNAGFSTANPQQLFMPVIIDPEYHYDAVNVAVQENNLHSLLWWMKRLITLRKTHHAFGRGTLEMLHSDNTKVLTFIRRYGAECILVVANLSRFVQYVQLDLSDHRGLTPVELFGRTPFPPIGTDPYVFTLGPHGFYWFSLEARAAERIVARADEDAPPEIVLRGGIGNILDDAGVEQIEPHLPRYLARNRWFTAAEQSITGAAFKEIVRLPGAIRPQYLTLVRVSVASGEPSTWLVPLTVAEEAEARQIAEHNPAAVLAHVRSPESGSWVLYDATEDQDFGMRLLAAFDAGRTFRGMDGRIAVTATRAFRELLYASIGRLAPAPFATHQANTTILYGNRFVLKLFRRIEPGPNPDLEIGSALTKKGFPHAPVVLGAMEYRRGTAPFPVVGHLQQYVPNEGDAWTVTLDHVRGYFDRISASDHRGAVIAPPSCDVLDTPAATIPPVVGELIGVYLEWARLIGRRTAELHLALSSLSRSADFRPEPFTRIYQRSLYQSLRNLTVQTMDTLETFRNTLPDDLAAVAKSLADRREEILVRFRWVLGRKIDSVRIRCHGDYHLGQLLFTGRDFVIIDFEGEASRTLSERRIKRSPFRDVAGMLRSFEYAAERTLQNYGGGRPQDRGRLDRWAATWKYYVAVVFLEAYLEAAEDAPFIPESREDLAALLDIFLLEKAVYELNYELSHRPGWAGIPLNGITRILDRHGHRT